MYVGPPVTGVSDKNWRPTLRRLLGPTDDWVDERDPDNPEDSPWRVTRITIDGVPTVRLSKYAIRLRWLRGEYLSLHPRSTEAEIKKYTRAYVMEMLGSIMFPDKSDDSVPVMYLQFLEDMDTKYNWGQAVLAFLYRQLYMASQAHVRSMAGPLMLLQQWAWTRFPIGRPESGFSLARLGASIDPRKRLAFGMKWSDDCLRWPRNPHAGKLK